MTDSRETGQLAYEAYANVKKWKDSGGYDLWAWEQLPAQEQHAWREAAHAAIRLGWVEAEPKSHAHHWGGRHAQSPLPPDAHYVPTTSSPSSEPDATSAGWRGPGKLRAPGKPSAER